MVFLTIMTIVNFICFGTFIGGCVLFYFGVAIDQFKQRYGRVALPALGIVVVLLILHFVFLETIQTPLLVPPIDTPAFFEFMRVMQYLASVAVVLVGAIIFILAILSRLDKRLNDKLAAAFAFLIIMFAIHFYILSEFGIPLIYPPNLWEEI